MRITGTFQDVYIAAKNYAQGGEIYGGCPTDPVVRRHKSGKWMLESGIESGADADFECSLNVFDHYFWDSYKNPDYLPNETDEADFVEHCEC